MTRINRILYRRRLRRHRSLASLCWFRSISAAVVIVVFGLLRFGNYHCSTTIPFLLFLVVHGQTTTTLPSSSDGSCRLLVILPFTSSSNSNSKDDNVDVGGWNQNMTQVAYSDLAGIFLAMDQFHAYHSVCRSSSKRDDDTETITTSRIYFPPPMVVNGRTDSKSTLRAVLQAQRQPSASSSNRICAVLFGTPFDPESMQAVLSVLTATLEEK
jgi:hypothetical protein